MQMAILLATMVPTPYDSRRESRPPGGFPHELGLEVLAALPRPLVPLVGRELNAEPGAEDREEDVPQFVLQFDHLPSPRGCRACRNCHWQPLEWNKAVSHWVNSQVAMRPLPREAHGRPILADASR